MVEQAKATTTSAYTRREINLSLQNVSTMMLLHFAEREGVDSVFGCTSECLNSNITCLGVTYSPSSHLCKLGSWMVPTNATSQPVDTEIFFSGPFCNTRDNITLDSSGNISHCDLRGCQDEKVYTSCRDVVSTEPRVVVKLASGVVVMCDTATDQGGWTIIQKRVNGTINFQRNWTDYKNGFGDYGLQEFYLGNENIYCMTSKRNYELRIDMTFSGQSYYAKYSNFSVSSEAGAYLLSVAGYTGTAMDSLAVSHSGYKFSTPETDNDGQPMTNCASINKGGWWYGGINCCTSNLNGQYGGPTLGGLVWTPLTMASTLANCEMKIRPVL
ncbi:techylectin-like protein [Physella acuta]|uniref:techylectin-like protein n=1 Tax=Physella acuta TaxID=109671 RepID=UPI0027DD78BC|nr:techylectin-like protein [Physella acuta]